MNVVALFPEEGMEVNVAHSNSLPGLTYQNHVILRGHLQQPFVIPGLLYYSNHP
jgi:hypothetical protein